MSLFYVIHFLDIEEKINILHYFYFQTFRFFTVFVMGNICDYYNSSYSSVGKQESQLNTFHVRPDTDPLSLLPGVFAFSQPVIVWGTVIVSKMASNSLLNLSLSHQTTKWCDNKRTQGGNLRGFNSSAERAIRSHRVKQRRETLKGKWYSPRRQFNTAIEWRGALFLFQAGFWYITEKKIKYKVITNLEEKQKEVGTDIDG